MVTLKTIARNEICQVGECADAITIQEITEDEKRSIGIEGEMQLVFRFPYERELRVPVTIDALIEVGLMKVGSDDAR